MLPPGQNVDEPSVAWSRDASDRKTSGLRALFSLLDARWGSSKKRKDDDDDDDDLPGPNATATLFPLLTLGALGFGRIASA